MKCTECGMGYVPGYPEDEKEHKKLHELRNKIVFNAMGVASANGKVTDEEHTLVKEIIRILKE